VVLLPFLIKALNTRFIARPMPQVLSRLSRLMNQKERGNKSRVMKFLGRGDFAAKFLIIPRSRSDINQLIAEWSNGQISIRLWLLLLNYSGKEKESRANKHVLFISLELGLLCAVPFTLFCKHLFSVSRLAFMVYQMFVLHKHSSTLFSLSF
jgi:hypothetical protein